MMDELLAQARAMVEKGAVLVQEIEHSHTQNTGLDEEIKDALARTTEICRCVELGLNGSMTRAELYSFRGCRDPRYACPVLDRVRRKF